jgi:hypothetical protein
LGLALQRGVGWFAVTFQTWNIARGLVMANASEARDHPQAAGLAVPRLIVIAIAAFVLLLAAAAPARADTLFTDGFESGDFTAWSQVQTGADGMAVVQSAIHSTGLLAAQLTASATSGSKAYVRKAFAPAQTDLTATGDFRVVQAPASGGNVPFFRFYDPASTRLITVYRQNGTSGSINLGYGGTNYSTGATLALNTWATIAVHVITAGTASTIEVSVNGTVRYRTTTASLGTAGVATVQIGNDTAAQAFSIVADTISVNGAASSTNSPPVNVSPPTISGMPQSGATLTASTGTWGGTQPIAYAYQWRRCDTSGAGCADIGGATGSSYTASSSDVGRTLRVAVTASNSFGSSTASSNPTSVVQAGSAAPANTSPPTITGTAQAGEVLNANPGAWTGTQPITYTYQWQRCDTGGGNCVAISGATNASYVATSADIGKTLRVGVVASNGAGSTPAISNATAVVSSGASPAGMVALWHMDERSGSSMFDAIGAHTGTLHSVTLGVPGFTGTAYGFAGSAYVSVPSASDLNPGNATLTVTIHVKTTSAPASPDWDLIRKGLYTTAGGEYKMEYQPSGQASCGFKGSAGYSELMAGPAVNNGQWHTVQCVKTSTAIKVVVDGQAFTKTANIGSIANTDAVPIGARPGSEYFQGALDEASIQIG